MNNSYLRRNNSTEVEIIDKNQNITQTIYTDELDTKLELENIIETLESQLEELKNKKLPKEKRDIT